MKHDEFVRYVMTDPRVHIPFFRLFLQDLERHLDFDQLRMESESFVSEELSKLVTDFLFQAPWREQEELFISILFEHKSEGSARGEPVSLVYQLRTQEMAFMQRYVRQNPGKKLPIVLLVGLYHGSRPYRGPRTVAESMAGPAELIPPRWRHEDVLIIDLSEWDEQTLGEGKLAMFLKVLKIVYDRDFVSKYKQMLPLLKDYDAKGEDRAFLIALNKYLLTRAHWENLLEFRKIALESYSEEVGGAVMTIADLLKKEGRQEGVQEGVERVASTMIRKGLDREAIAEFTGLTLNQIAMIAQRAS